MGFGYEYFCSPGFPYLSGSWLGMEMLSVMLSVYSTFEETATPRQEV